MITHKWKVIVLQLRFPRGHGSQPHALEAEPSLVVGPVCNGGSSCMGSLRIMRQDASRTQGAAAVSLKKAFQRGQSQRLKKSIACALEGHALLQSLSASEQPERKFCLVEVLLHAAQGSSWLAYEPVDLLCGTDLQQKAEQDIVIKQIEDLDPDLVITTASCGPWSSLQAIIDQDVVTWKRLMAYHLWSFTRKLWDSQTSRGKLCMTEQPWLSKALELEVMATRPHFHRAVIDQFEYSDWLIREVKVDAQADSSRL